MWYQHDQVVPYVYVDMLCWHHKAIAKLCMLFQIFKNYFADATVSNRGDQIVKDVYMKSDNCCLDPADSGPDNECQVCVLTPDIYIYVDHILLKLNHE